MFIILMQNMHCIEGFRMRGFTPYWLDEEVILIEGIQMCVLYVEKITIDMQFKKDEFWQGFAGKEITLIYMFNSS